MLLCPLRTGDISKTYTVLSIPKIHRCLTYGSWNVITVLNLLLTWFNHVILKEMQGFQSSIYSEKSELLLILIINKFFQCYLFLKKNIK